MPGGIIKDRPADAAGGGAGGGVPEAPGLSMDELLQLLGETPGTTGDSGGGGGGGGGSNSAGNSLASVYSQLWGMNPPPGVIEDALAQGLNPIQFANQIRQDPAWRNSPMYKQLKQQKVQSMLSILGVMPSG